MARSLNKRAWALLAMLSLAACQPSTPTVPVAGVPDFSQLVEAASPSVVNISTVGDPSPQAASGDTVAPDDAFGTEGDSPADGSTEPGSGEESMGSGFVLWKDGHILTNAHVVKGAKEILVRLSDRRELPARLVGLDEPSDLALLKVDAKDLVPVKPADMKKLKVGQWLLAIGSPYGFDYSVTVGIVSAKGRNLFTEQYVPFIQTDTAINPGNSGGPLFNMLGEVVGVNSQIYSQSGGNSGIAFAVPMDIALDVATQLKEHGRVKRGWLGVVVQQVTREVAQKLGQSLPEGAMVARVVSASPAERAGIKAGDVLLSFNDEALSASSDLPPKVGATAPGKDVRLQVLRGKQKLNIKVTVEELPPEAVSGSAPSTDLPPRAVLPLGLAVRALDNIERAAARVSEGGALVLATEDGAAVSAGVRAGDIVLKLQGQLIDGPERLKQVTALLTPGSTATLLVQRNGGPLFLVIDVPDSP